MTGSQTHHDDCLSYTSNGFCSRIWRVLVAIQGFLYLCIRFWRLLYRVDLSVSSGTPSPCYVSRAVIQDLAGSELNLIAGPRTRARRNWPPSLE